MIMSADYVVCNNCGEKMYVVKGTEVCPNCKRRGNLCWADENKQEVEVFTSEIVNYDDYENVINDTEKSIDD